MMTHYRNNNEEEETRIECAREDSSSYCSDNLIKNHNINYNIDNMSQDNDVAGRTEAEGASCSGSDDSDRQDDDYAGEGIEIDNLSSVDNYYYKNDVKKQRQRQYCMGFLCLGLLLAILAPSIAVPRRKHKGTNTIAAASNGAPQTEEEFQEFWTTACFQPTSCTDDVLDRLAGGYTCRARMQWLQDVLGYSRWEACLQLSKVEFPSICGPCNPAGLDTVSEELEYLAELYCYQPQDCTDDVLRTMAGGYPCGERIQWLMNVQGESLGDACFQVAVNEFPVQCGKCDPTGGTGVFVPPADNNGDNNGNAGEASGSGGDRDPPSGGEGNDGGDQTPPDAGNGSGNGGSNQPPPNNNNGGGVGNGNGTPGFLGEPFSNLHPVIDLNVLPFDRLPDSSPSGRLQFDDPAITAFPTNAWYQNILHLKENEVPNNNNRAYAIPYVVDMNGRIPGLRVHTFRNIATATAVTLTVDEPYALTLGATEDISGRNIAIGNPMGYTVKKATDLGFTLEWDYTTMRSSIVRGMPYATMKYSNLFQTGNSGRRILPTVVSDFPILGRLFVDGSYEMDCTDGSLFTADNDVEIRFQNGLKWLVFVSQPVSLQCSTTSGAAFILQVADLQDNTPSAAENFHMRLALVVPQADGNERTPTTPDFSSGYINLLRTRAKIYPGEDTSVSYDVSSNARQGTLTFDWDARNVDGSSADISDLLMFALPHHQDKMNGLSDEFCTVSLLGRVCPVEGSTWSMSENLPEVSFRAPRGPLARHIPALAESLRTDLAYRIADNFQIGAGDTYFGAKQMAKLARILVIAEEVREICSNPGNRYRDSCESSSIPTDDEVNAAVDHLREVLNVWFDGNRAEAPFVYDHAWGGIVSCGCYYQDGHCTNAYPNCPSFVDQGLNFGNGFYNDHHFHYGYYIFASAVVSHFDPAWGRDKFESVLVLIRDIANPSSRDVSFPVFRHKDWYFGSSWASGITQPPFPNGMNQESSSEAIAAYESVAMYGQVMRAAFESVGQTTEAMVSSEVHRVGLLLTATEVRSTKRYWQVSQTDPDRKVYPANYEQAVVGILWTTFIQFGTWFGNNPYLIYGIQLLPLTPISEERDDVGWASEVFGPLSDSCDRTCVAEGWSVQVLALLATLGHIDYAVGQALAMPSYVFRSAGGSGHSKSNTVWYLSTRPPVANPYPFDPNASYPWESALVQMNCDQPSRCTESVLNTPAGEFTCGERIRWLVNTAKLPQFNACMQIAVDEFPGECAPCDPRGRRRLGAK